MQSFHTLKSSPWACICATSSASSGSSGEVHHAHSQGQPQPAEDNPLCFRPDHSSYLWLPLRIYSFSESVSFLCLSLSQASTPSTPPKLLPIGLHLLLICSACEQPKANLSLLHQMLSFLSFNNATPPVLPSSPPPQARPPLSGL